MITRVKITNYLGIEALDVSLGPGATVATGRNGSGKTSFLKAIRAALAAANIGPDAIRKGADEAEILVDLDNVSVRRRITAKSSSLSVTKDEEFCVKAPQTYLTNILGTSPLDPMDLILFKAKERKQRVLSALPVSVTVDQLRKWWPKCPDNFDVSGHGLEVIETLRGKVYDKRTGANKIAKEARAESDRLAVLAAEALKNAPESAPNVAAAIVKYDEARGKVAALRARQEESEKVEARVASSRARVEELRAYVEQMQGKQERVSVAEIAINSGKLLEARSLVLSLEDQLKQARHNLELCQSLCDAMQEKNILADRNEASAVSAERQAKDIESAISLATVAPVSTEEMALAVLTECDAQASRNSAYQAEEARTKMVAAQSAAIESEAKAQAAEQEAARLGALVKALTDDAPRELLASCDGIPGLTLDGDDIRLDGKSLDNLCGAEQIRFAVEIARRANAKSKTLVVDKLEAIDPDSRQEFIRSATAGGWQLIASRVEAGELVIEVIGAQECAEAAE